ncbi:MAG: hypothetical protein FJ291_33855 [Planctomycetes bacterium]|nr:hypothetical protein [Planctomycetota bacterium]
MPEITYASIRPLIAKERLEGSVMYCTFQCPVSGFSVDASAMVQQSAGRQIAGQVGRDVKRSLIWQLRMAFTNFISRLFGGGTAGMIGSQAAYSATSAADQASYRPQQVTHTDAEKQAAVVAAFRQVASRFRYNEATRSWTAV